MDAKRMLVGSRKGLLDFRRNGNGWELRHTSHLGVPVPWATVDPRDGALWASLDHGHWGQKLSRASDGATNFEEVAAPAYPEGATLHTGEPATNRMTWVLEPGGADEPGVLYAGTIPGGLFRSEDDGASWELLRGLWDHPSRADGKWFGGGFDQAGIHSIVVDPADSAHLYVAVSCAGVFESRDRGASWVPRNRGLRADFLPDDQAEYGHDPHRMRPAPSDPAVLWQQNHCGVFVSRDGGAQWAEVSQEGGPVRFGFGVAVHDERPGTAWVVPGVADEKRVAVDGRLRVCRSDDHGASWVDLVDGLPQRDCFDIALRHALDACGETVAFGTTTGNLYWSDDGGAHWECAGNNLPPVYSVGLLR